MKPLLLTLLVSLSSPVYSQVVQWDIEKRAAPQQLERRANVPIEATIKNERARGGYYATVGIGNPSQNLTLQIDTGSSDSWVPYSSARICSDADSSGCAFGSFDPGLSSSFMTAGSGLFEITYTDNSYSRGDYFMDDFRIGGAKIENLTMGLGVQTSISHGLVGIGYAINEASSSTAQAIYPNLPIAMQQADLIKSVAYSLWLNDLDASTGNILFGGIDTGKYLGDLASIEILLDERAERFTHFTVAMTSLEATSPTGSDSLGSDEYPLRAVLDSGTTLTYLPKAMADQVWEEVGAKYEPQFGMAILPCSYSNNPGHFSFGFAGPNGPRINITMDELVVDLTNGRPPRFTSGPYNGEDVCAFGIQNYSSNSYILGDTFLRSAYVVYDITNNQIAMAPTNFNSTETSIVAFESKGAPIPSATTVPDQDMNVEPANPVGTELTAADGFQGIDSSSSTRSASRFDIWMSILVVAVLAMNA